MSTLGTACYSVTVTGSNGSDIEVDSLITDVDGNEFRVVAVQVGASSANLLLQSLDNAPIVTAQTLTYDTEHTLTVTNFTAPTVNKYSGNLLFIDNRNSFVPSLDESVSIKTAIRF